MLTLILIHSYIPEKFSHGVVILIIKDKRGDCSPLESYRLITLSPILSKMFEYFLLGEYSKYMITNDLQFWFKKSLGCTNAIFYCQTNNRLIL